jgi:hypothetical protein
MGVGGTVHGRLVAESIETVKEAHRSWPPLVTQKFQRH